MGKVGDELLQLVAPAVLLSAQCCFAAAAISVAFWLFFGGVLTFSHKGEQQLLHSFTFLYDTQTRSLLFLWLAPAVLAVSATVMLALRPVVKQRLGSSNSVAPGSKLMSRLLPPR